MKQLFTSRGKNEQSKLMPAVKMIAEGLQWLGPVQISHSEKHPMKCKSYIKRRK